MNREQAKALLPIITAFAEGKTVQIRHNSIDSSAWQARECFSFEGAPSTYRIKPEPEKLYLIVNKNGERVRVSGSLSEAEAQIDYYNKYYDYCPHTIKEFVEVIKGA